MRNSNILVGRLSKDPQAVTDQRAANRINQEKAPYEQETGTYDPYGMSEGLIEINDEDVPF